MGGEKMQISEKEIQQLVSQIVQQTIRQDNQSEVLDKPAVKSELTTLSEEHLGVFDKMEDAINAAEKAKQQYSQYTIKDRERFIESIKKWTLKEKYDLSKRVVEETGLGNYEDKIKKHELAARTPGTERLETKAQSGDTGLAIIEEAPFGVIGATTPVTNPSETVISNAIGMLAAGNTVVFNVHPSSKNVCAYTVKQINRLIVNLGGPENLVTMVKNPSMESLNVMASCPKVNMLVGTGGPGLVKALLKSGKKAIGAGAGNPPVVVDETANIQKAARDIITGHSFDNNIVCILEKEVFVVDQVANELIESMVQEGAFLIKGDTIESMKQLITVEDQDGIHVRKEWVGKDPYKYLDALNISYTQKPKCIICETEFEHPFVQLELLMPILPIVRVENFHQGVDYAVKAEHGNRHTAICHSQNIDNITYYAKAINTTIFVKNAPSLAGIGVESESVVSFTIAGPTGEGITTSKDYTRARHCVLVDGFRII
jgi:propionaldehyde dehydrogenase